MIYSTTGKKTRRGLSPLLLVSSLAASALLSAGVFSPGVSWAAAKMDEKVCDKMKFAKIYFFGYEGLDLEKIRSAIPLQEGSEIEETPEAMSTLKERIERAVQEIAGKKPTDVAMVSFDKSWTMYIGLPGRSSHATTHNPTPVAKTELSPALSKIYSDTMDANAHALQTGLAGDRAKYDKLLDEAREQSKTVTDQLMHVLSDSSDPAQRRVAAHCLGLVANTQPQIDILSRASQDEDSIVRNNAVRALSVIADKDPQTARLIPAAQFIQLLNSGTWTDRNKGSFVISALLKNRDPRLIAEIRQKAMPSLKEIASWDSGHAYPALKIIGEIASIPEDKLNKLLMEDRRQEIFDALK